MPKRLDTGYSAAINTLAERLDDLTTEPYVSGRIYSSSTVHDFQQLSTEQALILAVVAQRAPVGNRLPHDIETVLQALSVEDDTHARRLLTWLEQVRDALGKLNPAIHGPIFSVLTG